jgi:hypothetical protein
VFAGWNLVQKHPRRAEKEFGISKIFQRTVSYDHDGQVVYLHSLRVGGIEDALVGCWLVRHGLTGRQALEKLAEARQGMLDAWRRAPYTERARKLVRRWRE